MKLKQTKLSNCWMFDMAPVAVLPSEAGDGLEEQDSYFT